MDHVPAKSPGREKPDPTSRFTLVEMLVVMVIVGVIFSVSLPAFRQLTSGSGVNAAASMVASELRMARQYAIANRKKVAVIMPMHHADMNPDAPYSAFRAAVITDGPAGSYVFQEWMPRSEWSYVPTGTAIMEADNDGGISNGSPTNAANLTLRPTHNTYTTVNDVDLRTLSTTGNDLANVDGVRAVVFSPSGRLLGSTSCITVGQAVYQTANNDWVIRDPVSATFNHSTANQLDIRIGLYTGRVEQKEWTDTDFAN